MQLEADTRGCVRGYVRACVRTPSGRGSQESHRVERKLDPGGKGSISQGRLRTVSWSGRRRQHILRQRSAHERTRLAERGVQQGFHGWAALRGYGEWQGQDAGVRDARHSEPDLAAGGLYPLFQRELVVP